jgi:GDP-4-dehydro-6-deoxy-D-mannose reductase
MNGHRALVFAGNSFIGKVLCQHLTRRGIDLVSTRQTKSDAARACDITVESDVVETMEAVRPTLIFQCAAATTSRDPRRLFDVHVNGIRYVLEAMKKITPTAVLVVFGSAAEYGPVPEARLPVGESECPNPTSFFGASKLAQTYLAQAAAAEWGLRIVVARPFNVIGPGLPDHYMAASLARRLIASCTDGSTEVQVANSHATRDFVDVRDVASAVVGLALRAAEDYPGPEIYNICTGMETAVGTVANCLASLAGAARWRDAGDGDSRSSIARSCGNPARIAARISWSPAISVQQSLIDMWRDMAGERSAASEWEASAL